jgi:hypothetical protein
VATTFSKHRLFLFLLGALAAGCSQEGEELVIASPWAEDRRSALLSDFRRWVAASPGMARAPVRLTWIPLIPGDDATRVVRRRAPPDLVLGVGAPDLRRLARSGWLVPVERRGHPLWCVTWRGPIGMALNPAVLRRRGLGSGTAVVPAGAGTGRAPEPPPRAERDDTVALDDFRRDSLALEWAQGELAAGSWAEGYARLVRWAGAPRPMGRQPGAAAAAFERGEVARALLVRGRSRGRAAASLPVVYLPSESRTPVEWVEGVALVRGGRNAALAQELVRFLASRGEAESPGPAAAQRESEEDPEESNLLTDLLGATLVDAQDELVAAWEKLAAAGHPERAEKWMTEAPPWPPASVQKLLGKGEEGGILLETLTAEITPDADIRNWLLRSWLAPTRRVDGQLLAELAAAQGGRLVHEPRFRTWLRSEWTAWARQRYRRVARLAEGAVP